MFKNISLLGLALFLISLNVGAVTGEFFDFNGTMRAVAGHNSKGGGMTCFSNPETGNLFRMGNECDIYSENIFVAKFLKHKSDKDKFFKSQIRLVYKNENSDRDWSQVQDGQNTGSQFILREAFVQGGRFDDSTVTYWAGKRFYREQDIWMNDSWYMDISGFGGGVEDIKIGDATLNLAYFRKNDIITETASATDIGNNGINHYDLRIRNIKTEFLGEFVTWLGYARSPDYKTPINGAEFEGFSGYVAGILNRNNFNDGFNHLILIYSTGLLQGQNLDGGYKYLKGSDDLKKAKEASRITFADQIMYKLTPNMDLNIAATLERRDNGAETYNLTDVYSLGMTTLYSFTDHYQLLLQAGHSILDPDGGSPRSLTRFTVAPQVAVGGFWGRPVIRVFYAKTFWNRENRGRVQASGPYAAETSGANMGIQGDVWF